MAKLALFSLLLVGAVAASGAPIELDAINVTETYDNICRNYTIQGSNFRFSSTYTAGCSGFGGYAFGGESYMSSVFISAPTYPETLMSFFPRQGLTQGFIDLPGIQNRVAVITGSLFAFGPDIVLPPTAPVGPLSVSVPFSLQGTLQACLLAANVFADSPCDPAYADFATVNINVTGLDSYSGYACAAYALQGCANFVETFVGTSTPTPEPATYALFVAAFVVALGAFLFRSQRSTHANARGGPPSVFN